jgi:hypothetical protein
MPNAASSFASAGRLRRIAMRLCVWRVHASTLLLLFSLQTAGAQVPGEPPRRVAWPLIDFVVVGDSTHGVQLLASPNLASQQGRERDRSQSMIITLAPEPTRRWAAGVAAMLDSVATVPRRKRKPFVTLALTGNFGHAHLRFIMAAKAGGPTPFELEVYDSSMVGDSARTVAWSVPTSGRDLISLLTALDAVSERSALDSASRPSRSAQVYQVGQVDRRPKLIGAPRLEYPVGALERHREGRVWMAFVIDTAGAVQSGTVRVIMSDGEEFTKAALASLARSRFAPGIRHGSPVSTFVWMPFAFSIR